MMNGPSEKVQYPQAQNDIKTNFKELLKTVFIKYKSISTHIKNFRAFGEKYFFDEISIFFSNFQYF